MRRLPPEMPWQDVLAVVNSRLPDSRRWTLQRLVRAALTRQLTRIVRPRPGNGTDGTSRAEPPSKQKRE